MNRMNPNGTAVITPADDEESSMDLSQILDVIRERLWLVVLFTLLGIFAGFAYAKRMPRTFYTTTVLEVNSSASTIFPRAEDLPAVPGAEMADVIVAGFRNRAFLQKVIEENRLLEDPDFLAKGQERTIEVATDALIGMQVVQARKGTPFLDVGIQHANPRTAQKLADILANGYIRQSIQRRVEANKLTSEFLVGEAAKLRKNVEQSEQALLDYVRKTKSISLQEKQDTVIAKLKSLSDQFLEAKAARIRLEADNEEIQKLASDPAAMLNIASVANHPAITAAKQQVASLETAIATLKLRYTEKHPKVIQCRLQLDEAKTALQDNLAGMPSLIHSSKESAVATERRFQTALEEQESAAMALNDQAVTYNVLTHEVNTNRALYDSILKTLKETEIAKGIQLNTIQIFEPAALPLVPLQPRRLKVVLIGLAGGMMVGVALCFGLSLIDSSLKTVEQAEQVTRLKVIGAIPRGNSRNRSDQALAVHRNPASPIAEAFRSLRTSVHLADRGAASSVVLFTSANAGEGKTFCAINYAIAVAQQGRRALLIDADLRVPMVEKTILPDSLHNGLSDYLEGKAGKAPTVHPTEMENLWVMPAGTPVGNPAEVLSTPVLTELMLSFRNVFHCIIIDTAPILPVSDAMLLLEHSDSVCLVACAGNTPRKEVLRAAQMLQNASGKQPSLILNQLFRARSIGRYAERYDASRSSYGTAGYRTASGLVGSADAVCRPS